MTVVWVANRIITTKEGTQDEVRHIPSHTRIAIMMGSDYTPGLYRITATVSMNPLPDVQKCTGWTKV